MIHYLDTQTAAPKFFNNPFCYTPHPLCIEAYQKVLEHIDNNYKLKTELSNGKMLGVLMVNCNNRIAFLAAYSGQLNYENDDYFVPAIYDYLDENGFFKTNERIISNLNKTICELENDAEFIQLKKLLYDETAKLNAEIENLRSTFNENKAQRHLLKNSQSISAELSAELIKQSQFEKAELKRRRKATDNYLNSIKSKIENHQDKIEQLKILRKSKSEDLQLQLFNNFKIKNFNNKTQTLTQIFYNYNQKLPPSGSGECCAPKLLDFAVNNNLKPLCMAEFWYGKSPISEIRVHNNHYPACNGKCKPILDFVLKGIGCSTIAKPIINLQQSEIEYIYQDQSIIVINKPAGMLSVEGKINQLSALEILRQQQNNQEINACHRLDMDTSGILIFAKNKNALSEIRKLFESKSIKKHYIAILNGIPKQKEGVINLPLLPDLNNRPRQIVDFQHGRTAITNYKILEIKNNLCLVSLNPITGRTHQLRVHCAHHLGLSTPIKGDPIYGTIDNRMYLHAEKIEFNYNGKQMIFSSPIHWNLSDFFAPT